MEQGHDLVVGQRQQRHQDHVLVLQQGCDHGGKRPSGADGGHEEDAPLHREGHQHAERRLVELVDVVGHHEHPLRSGAVGEMLPGAMEQRGAVVVAEPDVAGEVGRQQMGHRAERDRLRRRVPDHARRRPTGGGDEELLGQPRLADTGRTGQDHTTDRTVRVHVPEPFEQCPASGQWPADCHDASVAASTAVSRRSSTSG